MNQICKYPRTPHIEGSRFQSGDEDLDSVPYRELKGRYLVIEEKMDGANSAISFTQDGKLLLQSRGHYLTGGEREKHFALFKTWANSFKKRLFDLLGSRYIMYGEWLYAKHTVFYDKLPHYFMEFDIYDQERAIFLSTAARENLLKEFSFIKSVKVLYEGESHSKDIFMKLMTESSFIGESHIETLQNLAANDKLNIEKVIHETDNSNLMEGLYIKVEDPEEVTGRYKFVRSSFLNVVTDSETHWLNRPIIPNQLESGVDIFEE